jgi:hypothetical protein
MKKLKLVIVGMVLVISSGMASAANVSGNMTLTSDYIWRGMTQTKGEPSIMGGLDVAFDNGAYVGTFAAATNFGNETMELDYYVGYAGELVGVGYDIGHAEITYPGGTGDFAETYLGLSFMDIGLFFAQGDEFGDYLEISYGLDWGPGTVDLSYGDYEDSGSNILVGYNLDIGDYTLTIGYADYQHITDITKDEDTVFISISI